MTAVQPDLLRHVVLAATLAPSVHNTQPWRFIAGDDRLELHADLARQLGVLDPDGRQLHLSCGAALLHARVSARALGLDVTVELLPDPTEPTHLATLHLSPGRAAGEDDIALAGAILSRHTHRGGFDGRRLPDALVERLRLDVEAEGAILRPVISPDDRIELKVLLSRADKQERADDAYARELASWVRDGGPDGVPTDALNLVDGSTVAQRDFRLGERPHPDAPPVDDPDLLVVATHDDGPRSWLVAGQALALLLLRAADHGVLAQPLGQVTDAVGNRLGLRVALGMLALPQLVLRVGYATGASVTPRRPLEDVLPAVAG